MSVWLTIPSARPPAEAEKCLRKWHKQGYKIALWIDDWDDPPMEPDYTLCGNYPGYAVAVNRLVAHVMEYDPDANWFVTGGDDVDPDLNHTADEIARQCSEHFGARNAGRKLTSEFQFLPNPQDSLCRTFGIMQPTGDRFAGGSIDRICGSPWMGREFCRRINQGKGPLWPEYTHMFVDEELQEIAIKYGILWQRRDLIHLHHHFMRRDESINSIAVPKEIPAHLAEQNSQEHWDRAKAIFTARKAAGFPGSEPL